MDTAASQWLDRVTRTRDIDYYANAHTPAYRIPEAMKAFVKGRDAVMVVAASRAVVHAPRCETSTYDKGGATAQAELVSELV